MIFSLFGSKKKKDNLSDLLTEFVAYQQMITQISKAQSLQKLNRSDEARDVLIVAERIAVTQLRQSPHEKRAHMMMAIFYKEAGRPESAEPIIERLLDSGEFQLDEDERLILAGELQNIKRHRPASERAADSPNGFTQVYCCANCGRLHNFVSMPCPSCDWSPQTIEETARSIILSNSHFKMQALLVLTREMAKGRAASDVIPNLLDDAKAYLSDPQQRRTIEQVLLLLRENEHKNHRSLGMLRECSNCGQIVLFSGADECNKCGEAVNWPDAIRALVCMDNLLWLFERRIEVSPNESFSEFVCTLVVMTNNLLRKQEAPSTRDRQYALQLLVNMIAICDVNKGAIVDTKDINSLKIYLVKESMREDSEAMGLFLLKELELFVAKMTNGIRL